MEQNNEPPYWEDQATKEERLLAKIEKQMAKLEQKISAMKQERKELLKTLQSFSTGANCLLQRTDSPRFLPNRSQTSNRLQIFQQAPLNRGSEVSRLPVNSRARENKNFIRRSEPHRIDWFSLCPRQSATSPKHRCATNRSQP